MTGQRFIQQHSAQVTKPSRALVLKAKSDGAKPNYHSANDFSLARTKNQDANNIEVPDIVTFCSRTTRTPL